MEEETPPMCRHIRQVMMMYVSDSGQNQAKLNINATLPTVSDSDKSSNDI